MSKPTFSVKLARLQAQHPHKPYSELCSMLARRPRKKKPTVIPSKEIPYWYRKED